MKLSVIIPVYNASASINELVSCLKEELRGINYEVIMVNDGSRDNTENIAEAIVSGNENTRLISLRRNFGEHNAVLCGLNFAKGEYAVIIDDDLQNPPSEILKLLEEIEKGWDVVYSKYHAKKHSVLRNCCSFMNGVVAGFLMDKPRGLYLSSFKIIRREIVQEITRYKGPFPYIDGLILRSTHHISSVYVEHNVRSAGRSNYTLKKLFSLYLNMFVNFSIRPLRVFTLTGVLIFVIALIMSAWFIVGKFIYNEPPGWTSTVLIILLFSGFQVIFLGLLGEYLGKLYLDQNNTPQFVIRKNIQYASENDHE